MKLTPSVILSSVMLALVIGCGIGTYAEFRRHGILSAKTDALRTEIRQLDRQSVITRENNLRKSHERTSRTTNGRTVEEWIAFARRLRTPQAPDDAPGLLPPARMREFLTFLKNAPLDEILKMDHDLFTSHRLLFEDRLEITRTAILSAGVRDPQSTLAIFDAVPESIRALNLNLRAIPTILAHWLANDESAASAWLDEKLNTNSPMMTSVVKTCLPAPIAAHSPEFSFELLERFGKSVPPTAAGYVMQVALENSNGPRALEAMRNYFIKNPDAQATRNAAWNGVAIAAQGGGVEGAAWMVTAGVTQAEMTELAGAFTQSKSFLRADEWMLWMKDKIPEAQAAAFISEWSSNLVATNFEKTAGLINQIADSTVRTHAVSGFATRVARHDPAVAAEWTMTLPPSGRRDQLMSQILFEWERKDPDAAQAFAAEHAEGIGENPHD